MVNPNNLTPFWTTLSGDGPQTTNSPEVGAPMPVACTFTSLFVSLYGSSGAASNTVTVTLFRNRVATNMTCTAISSTGSVVTCTDTTHPVAVAVGDTMSLGYNQTNNVPIVRIGVGTRCQ